jgi:hypothetical protein
MDWKYEIFMVNLFKKDFITVFNRKGREEDKNIKRKEHKEILVINFALFIITISSLICLFLNY